MAWFLALATCSNDMQQATDLARWRWKPKNKREERRIMKNLLDYTRGLVLEKWDDIVKVGTALAQKGKMTRQEVEEIVGRF